jgi:hypothetical protein
MPNSFFQYEMLPTTWFYVSMLIILAMFFKFNRFWSVRNLDLIGLVMLTPGLLMLAMRNDQWGYAWLFGIGVLLVIRLFFDTIMVRRPLLEPNLTPGGLTFACFSLVFFIVAAITVNRGDQIDTVRTVRLEQILTTRHIQQRIGMNPNTLTISRDELGNLPPGFRPFLAFTERTNLAFVPPAKIQEEIMRSSYKPLEQPLTDNFLPTPQTFPPSLSSHLSSDREPPSIPFPPELPQSPSPFLVAVTPRPSTRLSSEPPTVEIPQVTLLSEQHFNPYDASGNTPTINAPNMPAPVMTDPANPLQVETLSGTPQLQPADLTAIRPNLSTLSRILASIMFGHLAIVFGFIYIGHCHFGNIQTGIACATLYLLHPYTNQMVGRLDHLIPGALILWAAALYRRPFLAGLCVGTASALVCYPICLVPLWCSFYWRRGWVRFLIGTVFVLILFVCLLLLSPNSLGSFHDQLCHLFGKSMLLIYNRADGFWSYYHMMYRVPLLAMFFALCFGMILWPAHKHLATLLNCSTLLMLGVQFWQIHQGGLYMAWYLPLLILTIFRPNLEDRTAQAAVVP